MAVWAVHETEQLINLVRENHTLYDPSSNDYRNRDVLKILWNNIANEMNRSGRIFISDMDCRDRWNSLRDGYRRCVKEGHVSAAGPKPKKKKTWHWSEAMSFLKPYIQERTSFAVESAIDPHLKGQHSHANSVLQTKSLENYRLTNNMEVCRNNKEVISEDFSPDESSQQESVSCSVSEVKWQPSRASLVLHSNAVSPTVTAHPQTHLLLDPDEQFFRSLLPDVKVLTPRQKGIFKIQVQQLLQEMLYPKECVSVSSDQTHEAAPPSVSHVGYGGYGSIYSSDRWTNVQGSCNYDKSHSS